MKKIIALSLLFSASAFAVGVEQAWRFDGSEDPVLFPALHEGDLYAFRKSGKVEVLNLSTGASLETYQLGAGVSSAPLMDGEKIYAPCADGSLRLLNLSTGKILWTAKGLPERLTTPLIFQGRLYAGSGLNKPGVWSFDPEKGTQLSFIPTGAPIYAPLTVVGNRLYAATYQGQILRIDPVKAKAFRVLSTQGEFQKYAPVAYGDRLLMAPSAYHRRVELLDPSALKPAAIWGHSFERPSYYSMDEFVQFAFQPPENVRQGLRKYLASRGEPTPSLVSPEKKFYPTGLVYTSGLAVSGNEAALTINEPSFPPEALYQVMRIDLTSGKILSRFERLAEGLPLAYSFTPVMTATSMISVIGRNTIVSVDKRSGELEWEQATPAVVSGDPLYFKDRLIVPLEKGGLVAFRQSGAAALPDAFGMAQNVPNPFNPSTVISFQLPKAAKAVLKLYNVNGQELLTLINSRKEAGFYKVNWDGRGTFKRQLPSGVYFARFNAGPYTKTIKMLLQK